MNRFYIFIILMAASVAARADFNGAGYYRVQNYKTTRWISMIDDKGSISYSSTQADLQAIRTQKNFDVVCSDPASIIYIEPHGSMYDLAAQGTSLHRMVGHYMTIAQTTSANGQKTYYAKGTQSGMERYVGDGGWRLTVDVSYCVTSADGDFRRWYIRPLEDEGENYFGLKPSVEIGGKFYGTLYGGFSWSPYSEGVKAYAVTALYGDMARIEEIKETAAPSVPVVFECSSSNPSDNRLHIGGSGSAVSGNKLSGVYFCATTVPTHYNFVKYDPATMRVLGKTSDGSLGFITDSSLEYLPANSAYLKVEKGAPAEYRCVGPEEFSAGVDFVGEDAPVSSDVYNLQGILLLRNASDEQIESLPKGIYIIGGKKVRL